MGKKASSEDICRMAIRAFGVDAQERVCMEEMCELGKELMKRQRGASRESDIIDRIAEELADVEIMCEQMRIAHGIGNEVDRWKEYKLSILSNIIESRMAVICANCDESCSCVLSTDSRYHVSRDEALIGFDGSTTSMRRMGSICPSCGCDKPSRRPVR